jgi:hypothetical protein
MQSNQLNYITMKTTFRILGCLALILAFGYAGSENVTGAAVSVAAMTLFFFLGGMFTGNLHVIYAATEKEAGEVFARLRQKKTEPTVKTDEKGRLESMLFDGYLLLVKPNFIVANDYRYLTHLLICSGLKHNKI